MNSSTDSLFDQWRVTAAAACATDKANFARAIASIDGDGEPPAEAQWELGKSLRRQADDLLTLLVQDGFRDLARYSGRRGRAQAGAMNEPGNRAGSVRTYGPAS